MEEANPFTGRLEMLHLPLSWRRELYQRRSLHFLNRNTRLQGECNVCGNQTVFLYDKKGNYRESLVCTKCGTTSRYRSIARGLLLALAELSSVQAASISELSSHRGVLTCIYDTQVSFYSQVICYPIPDLLSKCRWIDVQTSTYDPNQPWGTKLAPNITNQNLEKLTFPDDHFDIVITSDVMEHVRLDDLAHREIVRVLKPHGIYLFTVPHVRDRTNTMIRVSTADREDPSKDEFLMEAEYHGDPNENRRSLCYRVYGKDLDETLKSLGFTVCYTIQDFPELGIKQTELFSCQLTK